MKFVLILVAFLIIDKQVDARTGSEVDEDEETCIKELNLDRANYMEAVGATRLLPDNNDDFTKLMGCTGRRKGMIKANGEVDLDKVAQELLTVMNNDSDLNPNEFKMYTQSLPDVIQQCKGQLPSGTTSELTLIKIFNCAIKELEQKLETV